MPNDAATYRPLVLVRLRSSPAAGPVGHGSSAFDAVVSWEAAELRAR